MAETMSYAAWRKENPNKHTALPSSAEAKRFMEYMEQMADKSGVGVLIGNINSGYRYIDEATANALTAWDYVTEQKKRMEQGPKINYYLMTSRNSGKNRMLYEINRLIAAGVDERTAEKTVLNNIYGAFATGPNESITTTRFLTPDDIKCINDVMNSMSNEKAKEIECKRHQDEIDALLSIYRKDLEELLEPTINKEKENNMKITKVYGEPLRIKEVIFNNPATIVFWNDDTKTVVKADNDAFDPEKGLAMAIAKKFLGNKGSYYNEFRKWLPEKDEAANE